MARAKKTDSLWMIAKKNGAGQPPSFSGPDELWEKACDYFEWVENNPMYSEKLFCQREKVVTGKVALIRAMTTGALCLHIGISESTWYNYCKDDEYLDITSRIKAIMRSQKFEGASAGLLNANIIARDLGLKDSTEVDHSSKDGSMSPKTFGELYGKPEPESN